MVVCSLSRPTLTPTIAIPGLDPGIAAAASVYGDPQVKPGDGEDWRDGPSRDTREHYVVAQGAHA